MKKKYTLQLGIIMFLMSMNFYVNGQTYNFTNATATGNIGPTQVMADTAYLGTTLDGNVTVTAGIQYWTVPTSGNYQIEAYGGQGYGSFGGRGAQMIGEFSLTAGTVLKIIVGQMAPPPVGSVNQYAGGGGSFVTTATNTPYVIAGGGGGNHGTSFVTTSDASITNNGYAGVAANSGAGGTSGSGGLGASSADGGGGITGNGGGTGGGFSFTNGGIGGAGTTSGHGEGGFGCGGGTSSWDNYRAGGGGGYSGGGGAGENGQINAPAAGGGGSFNSGTSQANLVGIQIGHGSVVISSLCPVTSALVADVTTLSDLTGVCSVAAPTSPTATNNCGQVTGNPDVTFPITTVGTTVVTWTFADGVNTVTQMQNVIITPIDNGASQIGADLSADISGYSYQWLYCDSANAIIPGDTNQTYTPTLAGNYSVEVTLNGCVDTSACLSFSFVGINEMEKQNFVMYPNPNKGIFTLNIKAKNVVVEIMNTQGQIVLTKNNVNTNQQIDLSNNAKGIYFVTVTSNQAVTTQKVIVQ